MTTSQQDVRDFLVSRRGRVTPEKAGLPVYGGNRRVPGLRREEVAMLAGVSVDYYNRLERGNLAGASESVLEAIARALLLDEAEREHLFDLARAAGPGLPSRRRAGSPAVRESMRTLVDAVTDGAAQLRNGRGDIVASNALTRELFAMIFEAPGAPNHSRFLFLDPRARDFHPNWERIAADNAAMLRTEAGRNPHDRGLSDLVGELSTRSEEFRTYWAQHNVRLHYTGTKVFNHPEVGLIELDYNGLQLPADPGLSMTIYTAAPGANAEKLRLLATLAATREAVSS
jgi:transcriptional regulator with XRE-family HTH domain